MAKDINKNEFPEETILKLEIFAECFREWFPVFVHNPFVKEVFIYDFFAGSGKDMVGNFGSPLILLNEAKGENSKYCSQIQNTNKHISFAFNEKEKDKFDTLVTNVNEFMKRCRESNCKYENCVYKYENFQQKKFKDVFNSADFQQNLNNRNFGKFILLDQYGFSQVDEDVFLQLVNAPKTDFIFFISSSFIRRFKDHPATKQYFDTAKINFDEAKPKECHRLIAQYFRDIIPSNKEYYLHHFTIRKGTNYWGLIFGSNHTLGMEKFLKTCWKEDNLSGESNCNINNDYQEGTLFYNPDESVKRQEIKSDIRQKVLSGKISCNIDGLKYALKNGCLPEIFTSVIKTLEKEKRIVRTGDPNYSSTNIHKVKQYKIAIL